MISVVIPLYNKGPHIAKTLESVLTQTVKPQEVIVVDDGSSDDGPDIVALYENRGVRLICQKNQGESAARNTGVSAAKHDYVAFLDADDWWLPNHLEVIVGLLNDYRDAALFSTAHLIYRDESSYRPRSPFKDGWMGIVPDFFRAYSQGLSLVNSTTACVSRKALQEVGGFPLGVRRGPDIVTWIKLALYYPVAHAQVVTAVYNQQAVNRSDVHRELEPPGSLQYIASLLKDGNLRPSQRRSVGRLFDRIAFFTAAGFSLNGDRSGACTIYKLAIGLNRVKVWAAIGGILLLPPNVLRVARRFRHRKVDD